MISRANLAAVESGSKPLYPSWRLRIAHALGIDEALLRDDAPSDARSTLAAATDQ